MVKQSLLLALLSLMSIHGKREWGLCNPVDSNIKNKELNVTNMMGIWFEYLVTPDFKQGQVYNCASWLMLQDNKNDSHFTVIYNRLDNDSNDT